MINKDKVFIIAELSANHNNDYDIAEKTIRAMAQSGADAVKVQTYRPESLAIDVDNEFFGPKKEGTWKGIRPWDLYQKGSMPYEWQPKLKKLAEDLGMVFFSSPFDLEAVDFLEKMDVPLYKIASFEINDIPLIKKVASQNKPVIISTGVAAEEDIELAINTCFEVGNKDVHILKCTSEYPAKIEDANLKTILDMKDRFKVNVGISDHTMGELVPMVAVSLGATIIEKHFILDRNQGGPDSGFSMEPEEFKSMVEKVRMVEKSLGQVKYNISDYAKSRRRSLFAVSNIKAGEIFTQENIRSVRPGVGLAPKFYENVLGKTAKTDILKGSPLSEELIVEKLI